MAKLKEQAQNRPRQKPDSWIIQAANQIPDGYYRVISGAPERDDLVWSWTTREWLRADSMEWRFMVDRIEDAVFVVRQARHKIEAGQAVKSYSLKRG